MIRRLAILLLAWFALAAFPTLPQVSQQKAAPQAAETKTEAVYVTKTGAKYHRDGCRHLSRSKRPMSLQDAKASGYTPCKVCRPPQ